MLVALAVPHLGADPERNLATIERLSAQALVEGARFLLFPEAVLTGLRNNDDPEHDLALGQTIPGPTVRRLAVLCRRHDCRMGLGLLEREVDRLYDAAVLLNADGETALHYRRIQPQWHGVNADPQVYCQGRDIPVAATPIGRVAFCICGDLFDDGVVARLAALAIDWILFPFARCFPGGVIDQERWDRDELPAYAQRVAMIGKPALMVNYWADESLGDDHSFGGAFVISAEGQLLASLPLGREGILYYSL